MGHIVRDVTRETFPDVVRMHNLKPGQRFTIIIEEASQAEQEAAVAKEKTGGTVSARFQALAGVGAMIAGPRTMAEIDADVREIRGDE